MRLFVHIVLYFGYTINSDDFSRAKWLVFAILSKRNLTIGNYMNNPFLTLNEWTLDVLETIKKDLKADHLSKDPVFHKAYFGNRPINRIESNEMFMAYQAELAKGNVDLAEWVINRWVFKNGDLYQHFAHKLSSINPEFDQIQSLTEEQSKEVLKGVKENFGAINAYLFTVLNGVVFPDSIITSLEQDALDEKQSLIKMVEEVQEKQTLEKILAAHAREVARLQDKISGVQKKYTTDTESLKKQIKALQAKLHATTR